jgi:hypothetical protein
MAELAAERYSDTEACHILGIHYDSWRKWKSLAGRDARFADSIARMRGIYKQARLSEIKASAAGIGMKQRDWRAAAFLLESVDPANFSQRGDVNVQVNASFGPELASAQQRIMDQARQLGYLDAGPCGVVPTTGSGALPEPKPVKALEDKTQ